jgi:hypothetical protein
MPLDFVSTVNYNLKAFSVDFVINPKHLHKFSTAAKLNWKKVRFISQNKPLIPKERGIYAFILEHNDSPLPPHGYVMYIGISGDKSQHTLRDRFGNYLRDKIVNKRPSIHYLLNNWEKCLFFHYAVVLDKRVSLSKLEKNMSDALVPPFSTNDFSGEIRQARKALRK